MCLILLYFYPVLGLFHFVFFQTTSWNSRKVCIFVLQYVLQKLLHLSVYVLCKGNINSDIMGVNFQATLLPHQRKSDGSNIIRIRVTHNGKSKWIKTNIVVSSSEQTKAGKPRSSAVMKPADKLIEKMTRQC